MDFQGLMLCSVLVLWSAEVHGFEDGQPMRFETPKMNEEEQHSPHTPKSFEMTCDACTAIAYQVIKFSLVEKFIPCQFDCMTMQY